MSAAPPESSADRHDIALGEPAVRTLQFVYSANGGVSIMPEFFPVSVDHELEQEFTSLAQQWRRETRHVSSIHERSMNRAYQKIIALGQDVVPLILRDLEDTRDHWLWALDIIQ